MRVHFAIAVFLGLLLVGCDSNGETFEIGGTYIGITEQFSDRTTTTEFEIPDTEDGESFRFTATATERDNDDDVISEDTVSGSGAYNHPQITLTVLSQPISGTVSDDGDEIRLEIEEGEFVTFSRD